MRLGFQVLHNSPLRSKESFGLYFKRFLISLCQGSRMSHWVEDLSVFKVVFNTWNYILGTSKLKGQYFNPKKCLKIGIASVMYKFKMPTILIYMGSKDWTFVTWDTLILELIFYESYIHDKMIKRSLTIEDIELRNVWSQCILTCLDLLMSMHREGMNTSSLLQMIPLVLDIFT